MVNHLHFSTGEHPSVVTNGTRGNFPLAFEVSSCHKRSTVRREAHRLQVQEGHSIGRFRSLGSTTPIQAWNRAATAHISRRVGGSRCLWIGKILSFRDLCNSKNRRG